MNKVIPQIRPITEYTRVPLGSTTVFTLWNEGTTNVLYGFGDISIKLKPGQTVTFDAGANTVFASSSELSINFEAAENGDNYCLLMSNTLTPTSREVSNVVEK